MSDFTPVIIDALPAPLLLLALGAVLALTGAALIALRASSRVPVWLVALGVWLAPVIVVARPWLRVAPSSPVQGFDLALHDSAAVFIGGICMAGVAKLPLLLLAVAGARVGPRSWVGPIIAGACMLAVAVVCVVGRFNTGMWALGVLSGAVAATASGLVAAACALGGRGASAEPAHRPEEAAVAACVTASSLVTSLEVSAWGLVTLLMLPNGRTLEDVALRAQFAPAALLALPGQPLVSWIAVSVAALPLAWAAVVSARAGRRDLVALVVLAAATALLVMWAGSPNEARLTAILTAATP